MCARILLAEDDRALQENMRYNLAKEGHDVQCFDDGQEILAAFKQQEPDLLILDIMMPKMDGMSVCREVRQQSIVPIIIVTAKNDEADILDGFQIGTDDYITKPFSVKEFVARVNAALRRMEMNSNNIQEEILKSGNLMLNVARHEVCLNGQIINLRSKEFDLLYYLMSNKGIALSRHVILEKVWQYKYRSDTRTVDVHMRWLRQKIESNSQKPQHLMTVHGIGYKFSD